MKKKISKKIVALLTMAAFVLTLLPVAAFAQEFQIGATTSTVATVELDAKSQVDYVATTNTTAAVSAAVNVTVGSKALASDNQLALWVVNSTAATTPIDVNAAVSATTDTVNLTEDSSGTVAQYTWWLHGGNGAEATDSFVVTISQNLSAGTYYIYAGTGYAGMTSGIANIGNQQRIGTITVVNASDVVSVNESKLLVDGQSTATATAGVAKTFTFDVNNVGGGPSGYALNVGGNAYAWVEDNAGKIVSGASFAQTKDADNKNVCDVSATPVKDGIWQLRGNIEDTDVLNVIVPAAGDGYKVRVVVAAKAPAVTAGDLVDLTATDLGLVGRVVPLTLNVSAAPVYTEAIVIDSVTGAGTVQYLGDAGYKVTMNDDVTASDTKTYTITGYAYTDAEKKVPAVGEQIAVTADKGITLLGLTDGKVTTDQTGKFTVQFVMDESGIYEFNFQEVKGDASATLTVVQGDVNLASIDKISDGGYVLAGTDINYAAQIYKGETFVPFGDAVKIALTDVYGRDAMGPGPLVGEAAADADADNHSDAVRIVSKASGSTLSASDIELAWDDNAGVYTLAYVGGNGYASDLIPGEYSVRVALNAGGNEAVTVSFTVAEFAGVEDLVLDMYAVSYGNTTSEDDSIQAIVDQVAFDQTVYVTPKYVDKNGLKVAVKSLNKMQYGVNGDAVKDVRVVGNQIVFDTVDNLAYNYDLIGSTIKVSVNDSVTNILAEKELTVVKNYLAETVALDSTQGVVGEPNTVKVSVVDGNDKLSMVNGKLAVTLVSQSDEDADVTVRVNPEVKNGVGSFYLESDKAGTADVRVVVTSSANGEIYAKTFTYTFGDKDPYAGTTVVMTIGSAEYVVNNKVVTGDAEPYVNTDFRTMVPIRVLAETFGATVEYEAGAISIVDGDTTIDMTVGETAYTVNDEAATMDSAPVIGTGDRAYVPVRFVAEALGYDVTPLYDVETGLTASVVFQK